MIHDVSVTLYFVVRLIGRLGAVPARSAQLTVEAVCLGPGASWALDAAGAEPWDGDGAHLASLAVLALALRAIVEGAWLAKGHVAASLVGACEAGWALHARSLRHICPGAIRAVHRSIDSVRCVLAGWRGFAVHHSLGGVVARAAWRLLVIQAAWAGHTLRALHASLTMLVGDLVVGAVKVAGLASFLAESGSCFRLLSIWALLGDILSLCTGRAGWALHADGLTSGCSPAVGALVRWAVLLGAEVTGWASTAILLAQLAVLATGAVGAD